MTEYVRVTFRPEGATRNRTVWAMAGRKRGPIAVFTKVNREGDTGDVPEVIILTTAEATAGVVPAVMSKKYCMLFLPDDPRLDNEIDRKS